MPGRIVEVETPDKKTRFFVQDGTGVVHFERVTKAAGSRVVYDVYGDVCALAFAKNLTKDAVQVRMGDVWYSAKNGDIIFIPPFSVVEWKLKNVEFYWNGIFIKAPPLLVSPNSACIFYDPNFVLPRSSHELLNIAQKIVSPKCVERFCTSNQKVIAAKQMMDLNYSEEYSIGDVAANVGLSASMMTRYFKDACGLSPLQYRNKVRLNNSLFKLLYNNESIAKVGLEVGFGDLSRYNKEFKKTFGVSPKSFKSKKFA